MVATLHKKSIILKSLPLQPILVSSSEHANFKAQFEYARKLGMYVLKF